MILMPHVQGLRLPSVATNVNFKTGGQTFLCAENSSSNGCNCKLSAQSYKDLTVLSWLAVRLITNKVADNHKIITGHYYSIITSLDHDI